MGSLYEIIIGREEVKLFNQFIFLALICFALSAQSANQSGNKRTPQTSRINDYGILTKLDYKNEGVSKVPFNIEKKQTRDYIYWQCFPREAISIKLEDLGNSAEELYWDDTYSLLTIELTDDKGVQHDYLMRRAWPVSTNLERFKIWQALLKHEKYVCIAGSSPSQVDEQNEKTKPKSILWYFEQFKTKKGCDSYFLNGCAGGKS